MIKIQSAWSYISIILLSLPLQCLADNASQSCSNPAFQVVVDQFIQPLVINNVVPSAEVGVYENGVVCYFSYGTTRVGWEDKSPSQDSIFEIGSITKTFTATLLALAQEKKFLSITDPVANQTDSPPWMSFNPYAQKVTYAELANFSSGMPRMPTNMNLRYNSDPTLRFSYEEYSLNDFSQFIQNWNPDSPLPAANVYSNVSYGVLGYLISYAFGYGDNFAALVEDEISTPLKMSDTVADVNDIQRDRLVQGYVVDNAEFSKSPVWPHSVLDASGILKSTAQDMITYIKANLATVDFANDPSLSPLIDAMQLTHKASYYYNDGFTGQGLAWVIIPQHKLHDELIWKNGVTAGYTSFIGLDPQKKLGIIVLTNGSNLNSYDIGDKVTYQGLQALTNIP